jgi:DNA uptake protein ComE-like DNA-binding protein
MKAYVAALLAAALFAAAPALAAQSEAAASAQAQTELIDINRAEAEELMKLKGIGEARAAAVIKGRPYTRKDELVHRKVIPRSVYDGIKDRIIAKH